MCLFVVVRNLETGHAIAIYPPYAEPVSVKTNGWQNTHTHILNLISKWPQMVHVPYVWF